MFSIRGAKRSAGLSAVTKVIHNSHHHLTPPPVAWSCDASSLSLTCRPLALYLLVSTGVELPAYESRTAATKIAVASGGPRGSWHTQEQPRAVPCPTCQSAWRRPSPSVLGDFSCPRLMLEAGGKLADATALRS